MLRAPSSALIRIHRWLIALMAVAGLLTTPRAQAGAADPYKGILITEMVLAPVEHEGVEIYNSNPTGVIDLTGVIITDRQGSATIEGQAEFPPKTFIAAGEFIWVFTSVSYVFTPDTSILAPGTQVFEDGESFTEFEGKPIRNLVNRIGNVSFSDIGDDVSLLAPGTQRPIVSGVNSDAVIDAFFSGTTVFTGLPSFFMGPDVLASPGDIGLFPTEGLSLQRFPSSQDTDVMIVDTVLSGLTAGRPLVQEVPHIDPATTALIGDYEGAGQMTVVTGLPDAPRVSGRIFSRALASEGAIGPDGDTALTVDAQRSILNVTSGLTGGADPFTSLLTPFDESVGSIPTAVRFAPSGSQATVSFLGEGTLVTFRGLPRSPAVASVLPLPIGDGPDDFDISPTDPDLAVVAMGGLERAFVVRGLTRRAPEMISLPIGLGANGVAITHSGERALVANAFSDSLTVIDDLSGTPHVAMTLVSPEIGQGPQAIAVSPAGDVAVVTNSLGDSVSVLADLDGPRPRVVASFQTPAFPAGAAFLPDGATAVVATTVEPGIVVLRDLLPNPENASVAATLLDPLLQSATFAEQSVLTFPPQPFAAYRESFDTGPGGWESGAAEPFFDAPTPDTGGGAIGLTASAAGATYGSWFAPRGVVPLFGDSLQALRMEVASDAPAGRSPSVRTRMATFDGSLAMTTTFSSRVGGEAEPNGVPSPFWTLLALPSPTGGGAAPAAPGGGDLAWDLIHFDPTDAIPSRLSVDEALVTRRTLSSLASGSLVASFEFAAGAEGWQFFTVEPAFAQATGHAENGFLATELTGPGEVGFWESPAIPGVPTDRLLRFTYRLSTDITPASRVPAVRLRIFTRDYQVIAEMFLFSVGDASHEPGPTPRNCQVYLTMPRVMRERGVAAVDLVAAFDVIGLEPSDASTGTISLDSLSLETLPLPSELQ